MILYEEKIQDDVVSQVVCEGIFDIFKKKKEDPEPEAAPQRKNIDETFKELTGKPYPDTIEKYYQYLKEKYEKETGAALDSDDFSPATWGRFDQEWDVDDDGRFDILSNGKKYVSWYKSDVQIFGGEFGTVWWSDEDKLLKVQHYIHPKDVHPSVPCKDIYDYDMFKKAMDKAVDELKIFNT